jgi:dTMP kinase
MTDRAARKGLFIVLEGPDGAGKSVQARTLAERLIERGLAVTYTREPGGTPLGEQVRQILLDPSDIARGPVADALLFNAARSQLVPDVIVPALERGDIVVLDRYATSTMAYQGYGSGVDRAVLSTIEALATGGLQPDLVVVLDVPVAVGLARRDAGHVDEMTRFEDESRHDLAFHERVREGYRKMAAADPEHWHVLDGSGSLEEVAEEISRVVDALLLQSGGHDAARKVSGQAGR